MPIQEWSDDITISEPENGPPFSDEMDSLIRRIENSETKPFVIIDMKSVMHVNSSNIAQLLKVRKILQDAGSRLRVCALTDQVWSVMLVTGLDKIFDFTEDVATSIASLQIDDDDD